MDFVTIVFNDKTELMLLKLQAYSFRFVDPHTVHTIYIVSNDDIDNKLYRQELKKIQRLYPTTMKTQIVSLNDLHLSFQRTDWFNQQIIKLEISKLITAPCYVILDAKNHFIRYTQQCDFIDKDTNQPILFLDNPGSMLHYFHNCMAYWGDTDFLLPDNKNLLTTTPYVIQTQDCRDMLREIERKEKTDFSTFFKLNLCKYTEFYLYSCFLISSNRIQNYSFHPPNCVAIFNADPQLHEFNRFEKKSVVLTDERIKVFGLHRNAIPYLDDTYKENLLELYRHFYRDNGYSDNGYVYCCSLLQ